MRKFGYLVLVLGMLSACTHDVNLTYTCVPSGATIYEEGIGRVGVCPMTLTYSPYDDKVNDGKILVDKIKVMWLSGTTIRVAPTTLDIPDDHHITLTFTHPEDTIDYDRDVRYGASLDDSMPVPEKRHIVTPGEDESFFDAFNDRFTCVFKGMIGSVYAECN